MHKAEMISYRIDINDKPKVVVAGDPRLAADVRKWMPDALCDLSLVETGASLIDSLLASNTDLAIINSNLPDIDAISIVQSVSSLKRPPYLIIRSDTDEEIDRVILLEIGADDCIALSCGPREIKARVRAVFRRRFGQANHLNVFVKNPDNHLPEATFLGWTLDRNRRQLYSASGEVTSLTHSEYLILNALFSEPGVIKDRSSLMGLMADINQVFEERSLDVFISRLRKKILTRGRNDLIETVRGKGYRLRVSTSDQLPSSTR
ncbi:response regulator transcription factor [Sphingomonas sp. CFBP9019]|uniref:winged helix-turn-helix transcriptional regulator n=1 Tax=Sphingomonas sp. CFBP9019 TaxID=3096532 RepID=UPI002A6B4EDE|nr:response regulator transcription factor [Sphingomonas sp. CFBP9019]MDY1008841.1 response regulator transcription factor [Sphingomonas sp. CFBP9019]